MLKSIRKGAHISGEQKEIIANLNKLNNASEKVIQKQ